MVAVEHPCSASRCSVYICLQPRVQYPAEEQAESNVAQRNSDGVGIHLGLEERGMEGKVPKAPILNRHFHLFEMAVQVLDGVLRWPPKEKKQLLGECYIVGFDYGR